MPCSALGFPFLFLSLFPRVFQCDTTSSSLCPHGSDVLDISWSFLWGCSGSRGSSCPSQPLSGQLSSSPSLQHAPAAWAAPAVPLGRRHRGCQAAPRVPARATETRAEAPEPSPGLAAPPAAPLPQSIPRLFPCRASPASRRLEFGRGIPGSASPAPSSGAVPG